MKPLLRRWLASAIPTTHPLFTVTRSPAPTVTKHTTTQHLLHQLKQEPKHYALIAVHDQLRLVTPGDIVIFNRLNTNLGDILSFNRIREIGSPGYVVRGQPEINASWIRVVGTVIGHPESKAVVVRKFKKRKNYHRHYVHRQRHTVVRISQIDIIPPSE